MKTEHEEETIFRIFEPPKCVGYYFLDCGEGTKFNISMYKKPILIHRFFMKHLLGFKYQTEGKIK